MSIDNPDAALRIFEAGRRHVVARLHHAFTNQLGAHGDLDSVDPAAIDRLVNEAADRAGAQLWRISLAEGAAEEFGVTVGDALAHPAVAAAEQLVDAPEDPLPPPTAARLPDAALAPTPAPEADAGVRTGAPSRWTVSPDWETTDEPDDTEDDDDSGPAADVDDSAAHDGAAAASVAARPEASEPESATPTAVHELEHDDDQDEDDEATGAAPTETDALRIAAVHASGIESLRPGDKDIELRLWDAGLDVIKQSSGIAIGRLNWAEVTEIELGEKKGGLRGRRLSRLLVVRTERGEASFELPGLTDQAAAEQLEPMLDRLRVSGHLAG